MSHAGSVSVRWECSRSRRAFHLGRDLGIESGILGGGVFQGKQKFERNVSVLRRGKGAGVRSDERVGDESRQSNRQRRLIGQSPTHPFHSGSEHCFYGITKITTCQYVNVCILFTHYVLGNSVARLHPPIVAQTIVLRPQSSLAPNS